MSRDELLAASREPNVAAFLAVIRACEGTAGERGYQTIYGYEYFKDYSGHPNRVVSKGRYSSSAAGAYQIISDTWSWLVAQYGFLDFAPETQDAAAVGLLVRRKALDAVRSGDLPTAVHLAGKEWASLPGSPYGQPTRSMDFVRRVFKIHGGVETAGPSLSPQPKPANSPINTMAPVVAALLPALVGLIPELGKLFGSGSAVSERNLAAAQKVADVVVAATQAPNLQGAIETMEREPAARQAAANAVQSIWYELQPADGGGIAGARTAALAMTEGRDWRAIGYGVTLGVLALVIVAGGGALIWVLLTDPNTNAEQRGMLIGAVVALMGSVVAFFFGSSVSSRAKDNALVSELGKR